jgi:hypothetical protein
MSNLYRNIVRQLRAVETPFCIPRKDLVAMGWTPSKEFSAMKLSIINRRLIAFDKDGDLDIGPANLIIKNESEWKNMVH